MYTVEQIRIAGTEGEVNHHDVEHIISTLEIIYGSGNSQNSGKPLVSRSAEFEKPKETLSKDEILKEAKRLWQLPNKLAAVKQVQRLGYGLKDAKMYCEQHFG